MKIDGFCNGWCLIQPYAGWLIVAAAQAVLESDFQGLRLLAERSRAGEGPRVPQLAAKEWCTMQVKGWGLILYIFYKYQGEVLLVLEIYQF